MFALKELLTILKILTENKIPVIPLKGAFASDLIFNDFGVYPSGDIDILVQRDDLFYSRDLLCDTAGYVSVQDISEKDLLDNHYHLNLTRNMLLEIHWNLVKRYFHIPVDFWWKTSEPITWNKINILDLSVENSVLYNIFRLFDHCFFPLKFFVLLGGIIEKKYDSINWHGLLKVADEYRMQKLVICTLKLLNELLKIKIPEHLIQNNYIGYPKFKALVLSGIFSGVEKKHFRMMFYSLFLIDSKTVIKILIARIFSSVGELRLRYNLPPDSKMVYLYYILNPFLLLFKK